MISPIKCKIDMLENFSNRVDSHLASVCSPDQFLQCEANKRLEHCMYVTHTLLINVNFLSRLLSILFILTIHNTQFVTLGKKIDWCWILDVIPASLQNDCHHPYRELQLLVGCKITTPCMTLSSKESTRDHVPNEQKTTSLLDNNSESHTSLTYHGHYKPSCWWIEFINLLAKETSSWRICVKHKWLFSFFTLQLTKTLQFMLLWIKL